MHVLSEQPREPLTPRLSPESIFVIPAVVPTGVGLGVGLLTGGKEVVPFPDARVDDNAPPS
jgi:hypothetical protein